MTRQMDAAMAQMGFFDLSDRYASLIGATANTHRGQERKSDS
ncbi:hypothetical protein [Pelagovum sp. HNIBRBA483]